jgi:hypothetical protein
MIHRKLLMATAIVASVVTTACSDTTAPQNAPGGLPPAAILAPHSGPATAMATINGGGTADMEVPPGFLAGRTVFGMGIKLLSDGSATGEIHCIDLMGSDAPGNVFGKVTRWSKDAETGLVTLTVESGKLVTLPDRQPPQPSGAFTVTIQTFGGAGVGHWTLEQDGLVLCSEILTSGQIVYRRA